MKTTHSRKQVMWLIVALACTGCANGFDRSGIDNQWRQQSGFDPTPAQTDLDIQQIEMLRGQLMFPCRIAVFLDEGGTYWHWNAKDKAVMEGWAQTLKQEGIASEVFFISASDVNGGQEGGDRLKRLRIEAARCGADALLTIQGATVVDSYLNPAAVFNLTVIGAFLVPASHRDALFVLRGRMFDVRNGFLYMGLESSGEDGIIRPSMIVDEKPAVELAKRKALASFGPELLRRLRNLHRPGTQSGQLGTFKF
jgi:hypothetical protein